MDKLAYPLKQACKAMFSLTDEQFNLYDNDAAWKVQPQDKFYGVSWRQVNIDLSEVFIKRHYDMAFFGRSLVTRIKNSDKQLFIITDSGFVEEVAPLIHEFGAENVHLIKLYRLGCTFAGDSRKYLDADQLGITEYMLNNVNLDTYLACGSELIYSLTYPIKSAIL